jgi:hypothetical protein
LTCANFAAVQQSCALSHLSRGLTPTFLPCGQKFR